MIYDTELLLMHRLTSKLSEVCVIHACWHLCLRYSCGVRRRLFVITENGSRVGIVDVVERADDALVGGGHGTEGGVRYVVGLVRAGRVLGPFMI